MFSLLAHKKIRRQAEQINRYRELIHREASVGGRLFGPLRPGVKREFFCLDSRTWIWHEEWDDKNSQRHSVTTRYDIRPDGLVKMQDNARPSYVEPDEARNFYRAINLYAESVENEVYGSA